MTFEQAIRPAMWRCLEIFVAMFRNLSCGKATVHDAPRHSIPANCWRAGDASFEVTHVDG